MAIKPSPTIAGKLRKLFSNNKQTIEPAIGDSVPGGGGANVLTLYLGSKSLPNFSDNAYWAYKDANHTEEYESYEAAVAALNNADIIKVISGSSTDQSVAFACNTIQYIDSDREVVGLMIVDAQSHNEIVPCYLCFLELHGKRICPPCILTI